MRHHQYNSSFKFVKNPIEFNKYTKKEILQYCLGSTLYMPGTKDIADKIINKKLQGLTSMVMCFEDAISEESLPKAEANVIKTLEKLIRALNKHEISEMDLPLIFLRVRNLSQFKQFTKKLTHKQVKILAGFVFPKFNSKNGTLYLDHLHKLNDEHTEILYGMPILESVELALKETRLSELKTLKKLLFSYKSLILNIRVGTTDLSSIFGVRRGIDYSIYDILPVRDCLSDIINFFTREGDDYILSAPVWEYFLVDKQMKFKKTLEDKIHTSLFKRNHIINDATDGLLREVILDKANGFIGKTTIHPSHIKYVNAMQAVTEEEFLDAQQILKTTGGVIKSSKSNKMNEIKPHRSWANKIYHKSLAYGVIKDETDYFKLFR